jgi:Lrp/AsnC family transcriptional regulator, leucine-responsive regulatory protein
VAQPTKPPMSADLDSFDQAILGILQRDNGTTQRVIGEAVNLSAPAVQRRIRRMEETGVIRANVAIVDPEKVGQAITLIVDVELVSERTGLIDAAKQSFAEAPEVQQCYFVTGEADFVLVMTVATMAEYEALARRLFHSNENVKRFRTLVTMDRVKVGLELPIG